MRMFVNLSFFISLLPGTEQPSYNRTYTASHDYTDAGERQRVEPGGRSGENHLSPFSSPSSFPFVPPSLSSSCSNRRQQKYRPLRRATVPPRAPPHPASAALPGRAEPARPKTIGATWPTVAGNMWLCRLLQKNLAVTTL